MQQSETNKVCRLVFASMMLSGSEVMLFTEMSLRFVSAETMSKETTQELQGR